MIETFDNKYDGVIINNTTLPQNKDEFRTEMVRLIETFKNKKLIWIKVPIEKSDFIPILTNLDFEFHHCDEKNLMLVKKLTNGTFILTTPRLSEAVTRGKLVVVL